MTSTRFGRRTSSSRKTFRRNGEEEELGETGPDRVEGVSIRPYKTLKPSRKKRWNFPTGGVGLFLSESKGREKVEVQRK